jgi:hypothetical protein
MRNLWKPVLAGILLLGAAFPYLFSSVRWFISPGTIPNEMGGGTVWPWVGVIILIPFWSPLITGAICAFARRACWLACSSALVPVFLTIGLRPWGWEDVGFGYLLRTSSVFLYLPIMSLHYVLMVSAFILLLLSRHDFLDREISAERLYRPPKKWRKMIP